jgi:hypothetical protein
MARLIILQPAGFVVEEKAEDGERALLKPELRSILSMREEENRETSIRVHQA